MGKGCTPENLCSLCEEALREMREPDRIASLESSHAELLEAVTSICGVLVGEHASEVDKLKSIASVACAALKRSTEEKQ